VRIRTAEQKKNDLLRINAWAVAHPERTKQAVKDWQAKNRWIINLKSRF
jgi:hypothetical protein